MRESLNGWLGWQLMSKSSSSSQNKRGKHSLLRRQIQVKTFWICMCFYVCLGLVVLTHRNNCHPIFCWPHHSHGPNRPNNPMEKFKPHIPVFNQSEAWAEVMWSCSTNHRQAVLVWSVVFKIFIFYSNWSIYFLLEL